MGSTPNSLNPPDASKPEPVELKRRRCDNCPKFFMQTRADHRFHSAKCRREFHRNGAGFGQLKERIPKFITKEVARQIVELLTPEGIAAVQAAGRRRRERIAAAALTAKPKR